MKLKLFIRITLLMLCYSNVANSQPWLKNLPANKSKGELTLFDYKKAFNDYWEPFKVDKGFYYENGVKKKAAGWKQFKRWEYAVEGQVNPSTGEFPKKTAQQVYNDFLIANPPPPALQSAGWVSLGTNSSDGGSAGVGRISCIAFHPTDPNTYWVGAGSGGLWVTTTNGSSWTCLTDNNGALAVSDIAIPSDYATSNTIYIATGDRDASAGYSIGVLKSTNGGGTWSTTGISFLMPGWKISTLLMNPSNNQVLIAATTNGVYKTINGGANWSTQLTSSYFIDMKFKPGDFNTLYGSTTNGKIYISTNGGTSWILAFTAAGAGRIALAVSANQPTWVYAIACDVNDGSLYGIYKSTNSGTSYNQIFDGATSNLLGYEPDGTDTGGQGWYDLTIAASPLNANNVFIGGINTWSSQNGGSTWNISNHWIGAGVQEVHADKHALKFHSSGNLFEGNDGGVYVTTNNGALWTDKTNGLGISQMYKLGVSSTVPTETITGLQDNGTKLLSGGSWDDVTGGDGMECLIDYTNVNVQYSSYQNGSIKRTTNHWSSSVAITPPGAGTGAWVTPYIIDPVSPQTLYAGYADVWKTTDMGANWVSISSMNITSKIECMAIAASNNQVLYIASLHFILATTNGGVSWNDITGTLTTGTGIITYITVKNDDPNTLWVTLGGYTANTVFESTNGGTTWTNISAGLPQIPAYSIVQNKQSTGEVQLYVGTEVSVYFKRGANNWIPYNTDLPNVKIGELEISYNSNPQNTKLRAATYGRGLWESDVYFAPVAGTAFSSASICSGNFVTQNLIGFTGNIQWQQSANGSTGWASVSGGTGANSPVYTTPILTLTTYYRAEVTLLFYSTVYSNVITTTVTPFPSATANVTANVLTAGPAGASYQWVDCGNANAPIGGATNQIYTPTTNGSYAVIVTVSGCSDTSLCMAISTIGIDEIKNTPDFSIYPSPATNIITIAVSAALIGKEYFITDELGKVVLSGKLVSLASIVHINELAKGIYVIRVMGYSKKMIK